MRHRDRAVPAFAVALTGDAGMSDTFRWQALFQHAREPIFVLDGRRRLLFANRAWEAVTGRSFSDLRGLTCTRRQTVVEHAALSAALVPPPEVLEGRSARVTRPLPDAVTGPPWWEFDFLPLMGEKGLIGILGRIRAGARVDGPAARPLSETQAALRNRMADEHRLESLDGRFPALANTLVQARLAAQSRCPVLLVGEAGSGKSWLARAIHCAGAERERPFLSLDAASLPSPAVTGVLFGPLGLYRSDGAGTIYVHEPARLVLDVQDELAQRIGPGADMGPRIIAGTALVADPARPVADGSMLRALYDALTVLIIRLPPLRERAADLPALVPAILQQLSPTPLTLTPEASAAVATYAWPGNLPELQFALQNAIQNSSGDRIDVANLPLAVRQARLAAEIPAAPAETMPQLDAALEQLERQMIRAAIGKCKGNQTRAAELLGIWRPRLIRRMKALGIEDNP
jgi:transcriptional regulator with PAS, ATPase and Fis domain